MARTVLLCFLVGDENFCLIRIQFMWINKHDLVPISWKRIQVALSKHRSKLWRIHLLRYVQTKIFVSKTALCVFGPPHVTLLTIYYCWPLLFSFAELESCQAQTFNSFEFHRKCYVIVANIRCKYLPHACAPVNVLKVFGYVWLKKKYV